MAPPDPGRSQKEQDGRKQGNCNHFRLSTRVAGIVIEGKAFGLVVALLIGSRQCAQDLFVWVSVLPAGHAQAKLGDSVGFDFRSVVTEEPK